MLEVVKKNKTNLTKQRTNKLGKTEKATMSCQLNKLN